MSSLYIEIAERLAADIRAGQHAVGSMLPGEPRLAAQHGVSRSTIRAALSHLETLGFVSRRRGAGTRVEATAAPATYVHNMVASGDQLQFAGTTNRVVHFIEPMVADEDLAPRLDNRPGRRWIRIGQTRHTASNPVAVCWTDVYLGEKYGAISSEVAEFPGLIYSLVEQRFGIVITEIHQSLRAVGMPQEHAAVLQAEANSHALELTRRYRTVGGACAIVAISYLPAGRYTYDLTLHRTHKT